MQSADEQSPMAESGGLFLGCSPSLDLDGRPREVRLHLVPVHLESVGRPEEGDVVRVVLASLEGEPEQGGLVAVGADH